MRSRVLLVASVVVACRRDPSPPTLEIAQPASMPSGAEKITCRIGPKQTTLAFDESGLHLRFVTARGNTVSMFGQDVVVGAPADTLLANAFGRFADARAGEAWLDADAKVTSPEGKTATMKVSLHIDRAMSDRLEAARSAALLFPGETESASANKVAWVHPSDDEPAYVIGEGRWRDIDLVAFESSKRVLGKACGSIQSSWNDITVLGGYTSSYVELYDRRTGKLAGSTTIDGPVRCADAGSASNAAAVRAWVTAKLAR